MLSEVAWPGGQPHIALLRKRWSKGTDQAATSRQQRARLTQRGCMWRACCCLVRDLALDLWGNAEFRV